MNRLISRRARQRPFSTAGALGGNLAFGGHISTRTVIRRLHHQGMRARRTIKRPKSNLQSKEKQPLTVTPSPPKAVVPKMFLK
jgi:hypothetical protein